MEGRRQDSLKAVLTTQTQLSLRLIRYTMYMPPLISMVWPWM